MDGCVWLPLVTSSRSHVVTHGNTAWLAKLAKLAKLVSKVSAAWYPKSNHTPAYVLGFVVAVSVVEHPPDRQNLLAQNVQYKKCIFCASYLDIDFAYDTAHPPRDRRGLAATIEGQARAEAKVRQVAGQSAGRDIQHGKLVGGQLATIQKQPSISHKARDEIAEAVGMATAKPHTRLMPDFLS